jgi:hypothetical protein
MLMMWRTACIIGELFTPEVNPADVHQSEKAKMSPRRDTGQLREDSSDVVVFWQQIDYHVRGMPIPIFVNEYCQPTSTDSFRRTRFVMQMGSLLRCFNAPDDGIR